MATPAPDCIGLIMDGNRRWARERGLSPLEGHKAGYDKLKEVTDWCKEYDIHHLVVYAFSTENWVRSKEEVEHLLDLIRLLLQEVRERADPSEAVHIIGDLSRFPHDIQQGIAELHSNHSPEATHHLWVAASYGGRAELTAAMNTLAKKGPGPYSEEDVAQVLWATGMPDPDLILRTGGNHRLSNFLPWQSVYSELYFSDTHWPALSKEEFRGILERFKTEQRNFGA